jgi:molybdopterin synthase sulfur carrier subunit
MEDGHSTVLARNGTFGYGGRRVIGVKVRVYATLRRHLPKLAVGESAVVQLPSPATIGVALDYLGIARDEARSCFVNGLRHEIDHPLEEGDELAVFPPVGGGAS